MNKLSAKFYMPIILAMTLAGASNENEAIAAVVSTSGSVSLEASPFPGPSDTTIFVFDEQQSVGFVDSSGGHLDFGAIATGTLVNSHYFQFDPATNNAVVGIGAGSITFDGIILGVVTSTANLTATLTNGSTADDYYGLESILGAYPAGIPGTEAFRGLGSPGDDLMVGLGTNTLSIVGFDVTTPGAIDGVRVLTSVASIPLPAALPLLTGGLGLLGLLGWRRKRKAAPANA